MSKRIGYIDAMRGFTMFLVVYYHVLICTFKKSPGAWSINDIFVTFRMPLFFFLSGFLMYKRSHFSNISALSVFLKKKAEVQLLPTLFFSLLFSLIISAPYSTLILDKFKNGYWFTYALFFYFAVYSIGDFVISKLVKGNIKILIGLFLSIVIYGIAKYSVVPSCPWFNSVTSNIIGLPNFQFFIFFFLGAVVRAFWKRIEKLMDKESVVIIFLVGFIILQLIVQIPFTKNRLFANEAHYVYTLLQLLTGLVSIATIFIFFRKNEPKLSNSYIGIFLQYIGVRTLDIYLIHHLFIYTDMHFVGDFLARNSSLISELCVGVIVSTIIIGLCLLISSIIRCSDTLAKLLFGKVIKDSNLATDEK